MEASRAVSSGVDRTIKIWDLGRGFCKNGFLCAPTPRPHYCRSDMWEMVDNI